MSEYTALQQSIENLTHAVEKLEENLVRKDVYQSDQKGVDNKIRALEAGVTAVGATVEKIEERRAADRRLLLSAFVLPLVLILLQIYVAAQVSPR